jgi:hypothetical protein
MKKGLIISVVLLIYCFISPSPAFACGNVGEACCVKSSGVNYCNWMEGNPSSYMGSPCTCQVPACGDACGCLGTPCCVSSGGNNTCLWNQGHPTASAGLCTCQSAGAAGPLPSPVLIKPDFCTKNDEKSGISTALGCIPTDPQKLIIVLLPWAIGLGGGIAFLFMLYAAFLILTSTGDPEKLKNGQEILTNAIIGLLFVIFSTFLLRIIGIPIMEISK